MIEVDELNLSPSSQEAPGALGSTCQQDPQELQNRITTLQCDLIDWADRTNQCANDIKTLRSLVERAHSVLKNLICDLDHRISIVENFCYELPSQDCIKTLPEEQKWLHQRFDDIQNIFNFDTMIIQGIQKQGE